MIAIHAVLLPDGRVMTYGTTQQGKQTGRFDIDLWTPGNGIASGHLTLPNSTTTDLFCSAQIVVPQSGDILLAGGDIWNGSATTNEGNDDSLLFSPRNNRLTVGQSMNRRRWYATLTTLPNGATYVQGGKVEEGPNGSIGADRPEVREPDGNFRLLPNVDESDLWWWYPRNFTAPDGRVFGIADRSMYFVDVQGGGTRSGMGYAPADGPSGATSSEVMFAPGRILRCGGGALSTGYEFPGTDAAQVIDINDGIPRITATEPMPTPSHWHTATVGADGRVIVTGGSVGNNTIVDAHYTARIWNPATGRWTVGAESTSGFPRLYHATAILLPDASILVAGGGANGPRDNLNAEIYYPPYLFDASGQRASRPRVSQVPASLAVGQTFTVKPGDASKIRRVTLVKTGAVTHSFDMDQRFLELAFTRSGGILQVKAPRDAGQAPPGTYLLFIIDDRGVPSVGKMVSMRVPADPVIKVQWTPTIGSTMEGAPFQRTCPSGTALVGIVGGGSNEIARLRPLCVRVNGEGRWLGRPGEASDLAGMPGQIEFSRTCPKDMVVTGFRGWDADGVAGLELACHRLGKSGVLVGSVTYLGRVGSNAGTAHGRFSCGTRYPAYRIYGRASSSGVHAFGLRCRKPS